jgi:DNA mismatch endonuclease, patch repair protein
VPDVVDAATRSRMMAGIRSKNTKPERIVRSGLHRLGYRFSLHGRTLWGTPDLVMPKYQAVIFVHGCFWHGHDCSFFKMPSTRTGFWKRKFERNKLNDESARIALTGAGWRVAVIWECALRQKSEIQIAAEISRISAWLQSRRILLELREHRRKLV